MLLLKKAGIKKKTQTDKQRGREGERERPYSGLSSSPGVVVNCRCLEAAEPFFTALFTALLIGTWPSFRALGKDSSSPPSFDFQILFLLLCEYVCQILHDASSVEM